MKCRTCGKESNEFSTHKDFILHCRDCKVLKAASIYAELDTEIGIVMDIDMEEIAEPSESDTIYIPLEKCPREVEYIKENSQTMLVIWGRKMGDRFIIEHVKYPR